MSKKDMIQMNFVEVPLDSEIISLSKHRQINGGTTPAKSNEQIVIESGECNIKFRFKLVGLDRLNVLFDEIREPIATDNKETVPRNVTLHPDRVEDTRKYEKRKFNKEKATNDDNEDENLGKLDK